MDQANDAANHIKSKNLRIRDMCLNLKPFSLLLDPSEQDRVEQRLKAKGWVKTGLESQLTLGKLIDFS